MSVYRVNGAVYQGYTNFINYTVLNPEQTLVSRDSKIHESQCLDIARKDTFWYNCL